MYSLFQNLLFLIMLRQLLYHQIFLQLLILMIPTIRARQTDEVQKTYSFTVVNVGDGIDSMLVG